VLSAMAVFTFSTIGGSSKDGRVRMQALAEGISDPKRMMKSQETATKPKDGEGYLEIPKDPYHCPWLYFFVQLWSRITGGSLHSIKQGTCDSCWPPRP
jgi:hypothetical protein